MDREIGNRLAAAPKVRKDDVSGVGKTPANSHRLSPETVRSLKDEHEANVQSNRGYEARRLFGSQQTRLHPFLELALLETNLTDADLGAGDAVYNDVHVFLGESSADSRKAWLATLDAIESLKPNAVSPGTKGLAPRTPRRRSRRQGNTFAISTRSLPRRNRRWSSTTGCLLSIPIA